jgi:hypothetical protein
MPPSSPLTASTATLAMRTRIYGRVAKSELLFRGLRPDESSLPQFTIVEGPPAERSEVRATTLDDHDDRVVFSFCDTAVIRAHPAEHTSIELTACVGADLDALRSALLDDVLPYLIARSGAAVLHAAAVVIGGRALVLPAESHKGKSTLAAAFSRFGASILTDECAVIDPRSGAFVVQPGVPTVRLFPDSSSVLLAAPGGVPDEKTAHHEGLTFATEAAPLHGIALIDWPPDDTPERVEVVPVPGHAAAAALLELARFLPDGPARRHTSDALVELAACVPVARVTVPDDLAMLPTVCQALADWVGR